MTYARTLTYLTLLLTVFVLAISFLARGLLPIMLGQAYREAYRIVPLVALAYAFNGVQYCASPGVHIRAKTRYLSLFAVVAAIVNLGLNFLLIPRLGMMGAAWATTAAFLGLAAMTLALSQRVYPVAYEYGRITKIAGAGVVVYGAGLLAFPTTSVAGVVGVVALLVIAFVLLLAATGFFEKGERVALLGLLRRNSPVFS